MATAIPILPQIPPVPSVSTIEMGALEVATSIHKPKRTAANNELHSSAVSLLAEIKSNGQQAKDYNTRRREATASLRPVLTEIWQKFEAGETVGGFSGKEGWAKGQNITIRWCQKVIAGPQAKTNSVRLKVGKVVKIGETEYTLTRKMLDAITNAAPTPTTEPGEPKGASGPTADRDERHAEAKKQVVRKKKAEIPAKKPTQTKEEPAAKASTPEKVLVARIGHTTEFGVFPESCEEHTAANALTIGTKRACEDERDRLNAKRAPESRVTSAGRTTNTTGIRCRKRVTFGAHDNPAPNDLRITAQ